MVGLPVSLSGRDSAQTIETRAFAARLEQELPVPVELYDERFTTRLAERTGGRADEDSRAAAHLLESWLASQPGRGREWRDVPDGSPSATAADRGGGKATAQQRGRANERFVAAAAGTPAPATDAPVAFAQVRRPDLGRARARPRRRA